MRLDNLQFGATTEVVTNVRGQYAFPSLPVGNYRVQVSSPTSSPINPINGRQSANVTANTATADLDFGFVSNTSQWQNPVNRHDVNLDSVVSPIDALIIINDLNVRRSRSLVSTNFVPPPFIDVNGDGSVSPIDVLLIINYLNSRSGGSGEGEMSPPGSVKLSGLSDRLAAGDQSSQLQGDGEAFSEMVCFAVDARGGLWQVPGGQPSEAESEEEDEIVEIIELLVKNHFA